MVFIYLIFFMALNLFFYLFLNKKLVKKLLIIAGLFLISFICIHLFVLNGKFMSNETFFHLLYFSFTIIIFYYAGEVILSSFNKKADIKNHFVGKGFNIIRLYLIPFFVTLTQINFIFSIK